MKTVKCKFCKHSRTVHSGAEIQFFRYKHYLSLKDLAKMLNCSKSFLSDCEHGRRNLSSEQTDKILHHESVNPFYKVKKGFNENHK